ncbi:hypothetical protein [Wolinella succinogenes]|uniref:Uncharacterized protein n=1 Tax=Wolinella succinogenes (strain ATCC 29543 / DSM 1740 / CCUG 13145 / JCM 31913 / LMG 7466 / NCTC 11488 / FDC 602W) TaxID=273121 RepID=Q7MRT8_WOLSU|nr:hypothetical protein [Wolinella succinogenes]NLU34311.1 hypothetical protein [Wolinella succinogenes]CAE10148.1 hypothetical protein WS1049 [Wolinella succinogenes]VEG82356.1 Uncharacterised protein [Wolinella succinogenes]HCZ18212.1 hypothetical protein [Helicobacter sp.]
MDEQRESLKIEIEVLLNRLGGKEVMIDSKMIELFPTETLEGILEGLRKKAEQINEDHLEWLVGLVDGEKRGS